MRVELLQHLSSPTQQTLPCSLQLSLVVLSPHYQCRGEPGLPVVGDDLVSQSVITNDKVGLRRQNHKSLFLS